MRYDTMTIIVYFDLFYKRNIKKYVKKKSLKKESDPSTIWDVDRLLLNILTCFMNFSPPSHSCTILDIMKEYYEVFSLVFKNNNMFSSSSSDLNTHNEILLLSILIHFITLFSTFFFLFSFSDSTTILDNNEKKFWLRVYP